MLGKWSLKIKIILTSFSSQFSFQVIISAFVFMEIVFPAKVSFVFMNSLKINWRINLFTEALYEK